MAVFLLNNGMNKKEKGRRRISKLKGNCTNPERVFPNDRSMGVRCDDSIKRLMRKGASSSCCE